MNHLIDSDPATSYGSPNFRGFKIADTKVCPHCEGSKYFSECCGAMVYNIMNPKCDDCGYACEVTDCCECEGTGEKEE